MPPPPPPPNITFFHTLSHEELLAFKHKNVIFILLQQPPIKMKLSRSLTESTKKGTKSLEMPLRWTVMQCAQNMEPQVLKESKNIPKKIDLNTFLKVPSHQIRLG